MRKILKEEKLEVVKTMLEANDYFPAGCLLGEEADHLQKIILQFVGKVPQRHGNDNWLAYIQPIEIGVAKGSASPSLKAQVDSVKNARLSAVTGPVISQTRGLALDTLCLRSDAVCAGMR